jgi:serine/threonine protein kinase
LPKALQVVYLHKRGRLHCDVLRRNVLISGEKVVLIDLELSQSPGQPIHKEYPEELAILSTREQDPERELSEKTDIFLVGFCLVELMWGKDKSLEVFQDLKQSKSVEGWTLVISSLNKFSQPDGLESLYEQLVPLVQACLAWSSSQRPTAAQLVEALDTFCK